MAVKPASAWAQNWTASAGRATTAYTQGVDSYSGDWAGATTSQQAIMQQNWLQALSSGAWARGVTNMGTQGWKAHTVAKQANYGVGFQAGANRFAAAAAKLQPFMQQAVAALPARGDINANLQRSNALSLALHAQRGNFKASA